MSKLINQPIWLTTKEDFPVSFYFRRPYEIKYILKHWREGGQWWLDEPELFVYEVSTNHCFCELHFLPSLKQWVLYRLGV